MTTPTFSDEEIRILQEGWKEIESIQLDIARHHYDYLFERYPKLTPLFTVPFDIQGPRLISSFDFTIENLNDMEYVEYTLQKLGLKHKSFKVKKSHYPIIIESLQRAVREVLPQPQNGSIKIWDKLIKYMADMMVEGSKRKYIPKNPRATD